MGWHTKRCAGLVLQPDFPDVCVRLGNDDDQSGSTPDGWTPRSGRRSGLQSGINHHDVSTDTSTVQEGVGGLHAELAAFETKEAELSAIRRRLHDQIDHGFATEATQARERQVSDERRQLQHQIDALRELLGMQPDSLGGMLNTAGHTIGQARVWLSDGRACTVSLLEEPTPGAALVARDIPADTWVIAELREGQDGEVAYEVWVEDDLPQ